MPYDFMVNNNIEVKCPRCKSGAFVKGGTNAHNVRKLKCKLCSTTYVSTVNTLFEGTTYTSEDMCKIIYDLAAPVFYMKRGEKLYQQKASNSKRWLINHRILELASRMVDKTQQCGEFVNLPIPFSHKGISIMNHDKIIDVNILVTESNCYLIKQSKIENIHIKNKQYLKNLTRYLLCIERGVSAKYVDLYIDWFSFVNNFVNKNNIKQFDISCAEKMLVEMSKFSIKNGGVVTLKYFE